jgi:hypothetical protein
MLCEPGTRPARLTAMTPASPGELPAVPVHVDGADLRAAVTGPPSAYAEASLEAEAARIRAPARR